MKVIGIDPSLTATGLAHVDGTTEVCGGAADVGDRRLIVIHDTVYAACRNERPDLAVIEDAPAHTHGSGALGMVQGAVRMALIRQHVPYVTVVAATLKKYATGNGGATKSDMRMAMYQRAGIDERNDNKVDAWWLRHLGLDWYGEPVVTIPIAQRAALKKIAWPLAHMIGGRAGS